jgi:hypothetical protein
MAHRAEQILAAINTSLNTIAGVTAERSQYYAVESDQLPFVMVKQGIDSKQTDFGNAFIDSLLRVELMVMVDESTNEYETALAAVRTDINKKLMDDYTQGLAFVIDTDEIDASEPEHVDGDKPRAMQIINYEILYRRTRNDPEN